MSIPLCDSSNGAGERADGSQSRHALVAALSQLNERGTHPTTAELARHTGMSETNVRHHIGMLIRAGVVEIREVPRNLVRREIVLRAGA